MRPLALTIEGLTAFRSPQEISFEDLDLFVITGPTGAGKTSILDAITFALYGDVCRVKSGQLRDMVSHGATQVKVSLDFRVGDACYRVTRRLKKSGGGHEAILVRLEGDAEIPEVDSLAVRPTNQRVEEILGLDFDAFTKAVLLPQGAFHEFLKGDASARRRILVSLLDLRRYERAGGLARSKGNELSARLDERRSLIASEYADATAENLKQLKAAQKQAKGDHERLGKTQLQAKEKADAATTALKAASSLGDLADGFRVLDAEFAGLTRALQPLEDLTVTIATALKSTELKLDQAEKAAAVKQQALVKTIARVGDEAAIAVLESAATSWVDENSRLASLIAEVQSAATEVDTLAALERKAANDVGASKTRLTQAQTSMTALTKAFERASAIAECARAVAAEAAAKTKREAAKPERDDADAKAKDAAEHLRHVEQANLASALRRGLTAGDSCPVCASTIASLPKEDRNTASLLERAQRDVERAETRRRLCEQSFMTADAAYTLAATKLAEARSALPARVQIPALDDAEAALTDARAALESASDVLHQAESAAAVAESAVAEARSMHLAATTKREGLEREQTGVRERLGKAESELRKAFARQMPDDLPQAIAQRTELLVQARLEVAAAEQAARAARDDRDSVLTQQHEHEVDLTDIATRLAETRTKTELATAALEREVATASLPPLPEVGGQLSTQLEAWAACCRSYVAAATDAARMRVKISDGAMGELGKIIVPLGISIEDEDIDDLLTAIDESVQEAHRVLVETEAASSTLSTKIESRRQLEKAIADDSLLCSRYQALGKELQQNNFIAFVLAQSMERLAALATIELLKISDERYSLAAEDDGFDVIDHHNADERRSVATLSGGETFLASLALALALAGSVRDLAGAAAAGRLDAMFIDEGFGALDPETLEVVVDALERLREGERMVGVISHVAALADRIPGGLAVTKNGGVSTVTVR